MASILKFALVSITGGIAIGALAAASVPRDPVTPVDSEWNAGNQTSKPGSEPSPEAPVAEQVPPVENDGPQVAYTAPEWRDDQSRDTQDADEAADVGNLPEPQAQVDELAVPQDDRAGQAAEAAREAAEDARAAETAPRADDRS